MKFRALALAAAGALLAAGCASTPRGEPHGPEQFVAKVQAAGFGNKDIAPATDAPLRDEGLIVTTPGWGSFVAERPR